MIRAFLLCALTLGAALLPAQEEHPVLAIGAQAPDFSLPGIDGKTHSLAEYRQSVLVVMFICNHCPTSQLYEGRIKRLAEDYRKKSVGFVAIAPNSPKAVLYSELGYTDVDDGLEAMKIRAAYRAFNFPYLYDGETQKVAAAYGPAATPHIFIFDKERKLRYEGRIDDSQRESLVKKQDARAAIDALLAGKPVPVEKTPSVGCSTKWLSKSANKEREAQAIAAEPVKLEGVVEDGLKQLRANNTGKVMLVSFWATWCGPCIAEMRDLQDTFRMYRSRGFDMVTVSTNLPDESPGVLKILEREHATTRNLEFASNDTYGLQAAFDPSWRGAVPFAMLLAPGGKVLFQQQGELDILALRRAILANLENETYVGHPAYWAQK